MVDPNPAIEEVSTESKHIAIYETGYVQSIMNKVFLHAYDRKRTESGLTLGLRPANERRRYKATLSLIGWAQT